ncbi:hypothetical protein NOK12_20520 [Nocardioides sp. OK12]|uniref:YbaB/EbfC family nucleoid-associated protein n=1 Tax=Nocardioides sp. OK12 TaxID=2758661 RepID=UPI0021C2977A|nr:YbaB/EbfC family nucleoid-associated protein [Nocardioides sp. OK12]GHJ59534.1 hypothetical protein NOK12_20520 [Nocardioides sp. OK12]
MTSGPDDRVEQARASSLRRLQEIAEMQRQLAGVSGRAEAADGGVRVRVTPAGMPTELMISDEALELTGTELAAAIMQAVASATVSASQELRAIVGQVVPPDQLDALLRGTTSDADVAGVQEQIDALRSDVR